MNSYYNIIETLVGILCVDKGVLKVLLKKKQNTPYKGYWILPGGFLTNEETLEENVTKVIETSTNIKGIPFEQCHLFSNLNRDSEDSILASTFLAFTTKELAVTKISNVEYGWFDLNKLPKLGYDHNIILQKISDVVRANVKNNTNGTIYKLFPNDFTIPELQVFFEYLLNKKLDRRNFRKKLILQDIIEDTGFKTLGSAGRPGKLYRFKQKGEIKNEIR